MDKQSGQREDVPSQDEYIAVYGQTVRGNSPFWYEYGQSGRQCVVIGKVPYQSPTNGTDNTFWFARPASTARRLVCHSRGSNPGRKAPACCLRSSLCRTRPLSRTAETQSTPTWGRCTGSKKRKRQSVVTCISGIGKGSDGVGLVTVASTLSTGRLVDVTYAIQGSN